DLARRAAGPRPRRHPDRPARDHRDRRRPDGAPGPRHAPGGRRAPRAVRGLRVLRDLAVSALERAADAIAGLARDRRALVAVDGVDGAGKTPFADALAPRLGRPVVRASDDDF